MSYSVPSFNIAVDFWYQGRPTSNPADATLQAQLYYRAKAPLFDGSPLGSAPLEGAYLRISYADMAAWLWDVGSIVKVKFPGIGDYYYLLTYWDIMHLGFANQYCEMLVTQCLPDGSIPDTTR
jgi:hypothetical protein